MPDVLCSCHVRDGSWNVEKFVEKCYVILSLRHCFLRFRQLDFFSLLHKFYYTPDELDADKKLTTEKLRLEIKGNLLNFRETVKAFVIFHENNLQKVLLTLLKFVIFQKRNYLLKT